MSYASRPRAASLRSPDAVMEPSGKAMAVRDRDPSGVSGRTASGGGKDTCILDCPAYQLICVPLDEDSDHKIR
jgi:hypothetical protein